MSYEKLASCIYSRATKQAALISPELIRKSKLVGSKALDSIGITRGLEGRVMQHYAKLENDRLARLARQKILPAGLAAGAAGGYLGHRYSSPIMNKLETYLPELSFIPGTNKSLPTKHTAAEIAQSKPITNIPSSSGPSAQELAESKFMNNASSSSGPSAQELAEAKFMNNASSSSGPISNTLSSAPVVQNLTEQQRWENFVTKGQALQDQIKAMTGLVDKATSSFGQVVDQTSNLR
jgi:hypothetical protein